MLSFAISFINLTKTALLILKIYFMKKSILLIFIALMTAMGSQAQEAEVVKSKPTLRGYKAFYEAEYGFDIDNEEVDNNGEKISNYPHCNNLMISTTQGYQVNNFFFAGGGVGILHYVDGNRTVMPIFADIRFNLLDNKFIMPILNARVGYVVGSWGGIYSSAWVGARLNLMHNHAASISVGVSHHNDQFSSTNNDFEWTATSFGIKLGYEF